MPGKQMAIDAVQSAGLIDKYQPRPAAPTWKVKRLRQQQLMLATPVAGLLITFINVIAGMIIGMMPGQLQEARTLLTIGDGPGQPVRR